MVSKEKFRNIFMERFLISSGKFEENFPAKIKIFPEKN